MKKIYLVLSLLVYQGLLAHEINVQPRFAVEEEIPFRDRVGVYQLKQQNLGQCTETIIVSTRSGFNDLGPINDEELDIIGFDFNMINDYMTLTSQSSGFYRVAKSLDPGVDYDFGNEHISLRCQNWGCDTVQKNTSLTGTYFSSKNDLVIYQEFDGKQVLTCNYQRKLKPQIHLRGKWFGDLYPEYKMGEFSHYYNTELDISCTDEGKIEGVGKFEVRTNATIYDRQFALLSGRCIEGEDILLEFETYLLDSKGERKKEKLKAIIKNIEYNFKSKYMKNEVYSIDIFDSNNKKWGLWSQPFSKSIEYRHL